MGLQEQHNPLSLHTKRTNNRRGKPDAEARMNGSETRTISEVAATALGVARRRAAQMQAMRDAFCRNEQDVAMAIARQLCGLSDAAMNAGSAGTDGAGHEATHSGR